jgi:group I intron endonuclease
MEKKYIGIYIWSNKITGKMYIGSSIDLARRLKSHFLGIRSNVELQSDIEEYGIQNFTVTIVEFIPLIEDISKLKGLIIEREQFYLDNLCNANKDSEDFDIISYNSMRKATSPLGHKHSEESKAKMSICKKGINLTEEHKQKIKDNHATKQLDFVHHRKKRPSTQKEIKGIIKMQTKNHVPILQYNAYTGDFIKEYISMAEAGRNLKMDASCISRNISGKTKICAGSIFMKKVSKNYPKNIEPIECNYIEVFDLDLNLLGVFKNPFEIEKTLGIHHSVVSRNLEKRGGIGKDNIFKYANKTN